MSAEDKLTAGIEAAMQQYERDRATEEGAALKADASRRAGNMSTDLIAFLRAALDAEEAIARAAIAPSGPSWRVDESGSTVHPLASHASLGFHIADAYYRDYAVHIARQDPEFVLADIAAKRAVIGAHDRPHECIELTGKGDHSAVDGQPWELWESQHTEDEGRPCFVIRALAEAYGIRTEGPTT